VFEVIGSLLQDKQVAALEIGVCSILWLHDLAVLCFSHQNLLTYLLTYSMEQSPS